jgi:hypothetical protein
VEDKTVSGEAGNEAYRERESDIIKIDPAAELHDPPLLEEEMYLEKYKIKKIIKPNVEYE